MADSDEHPTRGNSEGSVEDSTASGPPLAESPRRGAGLLLPAIALVIGLVVGGLFVGLTDLGGGDKASGGTPSTSSTASAGSTSSSSSSGLVITVPEACLNLTNDSQDLLDLVDQAVTAARDLDASELSSVVSKLQDAQSRLRTHTDSCRAAANASN